jgi:hypothetical protein
VKTRARPPLTACTSTRTRFKPHGITTYWQFPVTVAMIVTNGILKRARKSGMVLAI